MTTINFFTKKECNELEEDEKEKSAWWKLRKWAIHSLCRLFERYESLMVNLYFAFRFILFSFADC